MRALSACCGSCLNCVVFAAIITTSVFRFNTMGSLAALSTSPSKYYDRNFALGNDDKLIVPFDYSGDGMREYQDDATMIVWLWSLMMFLCCFNCCSMGFASKPPAVDAT